MRAGAFWNRLDFVQQFMVAGLLVLMATAAALGWWVAGQVEEGAVDRNLAMAALRADSLVAFWLWQDNPGASLSAEHQVVLDELARTVPLRAQVVSFKVWDSSGRILYASDPAAIGRTFPMGEDLARAWRGEVVSKPADMHEDENFLEREKWSRLVETFSPVRLGGTGPVVAVIEFYQRPEDLERGAAAARTRGWVAIGAALLAAYLLLAVLVRRGSSALVRDHAETREKVSRLAALLAQKEELQVWLSGAIARVIALNERKLSHLGAEIHAGPVQNLSLAILQLDNHAAQPPVPPDSGGSDGVEKDRQAQEVGAVRETVVRALQEVRAISRDARLPELGNLTPAETATRAVRAHERRSGVAVALHLEDPPEGASLPTRITLYRFVDEVLACAHLHGQGAAPRVRLAGDAGRLVVQVSFQGTCSNRAFFSAEGDKGEILACARERVESLGGSFRLKAERAGTRVVATLPLYLGESAPEACVPPTGRLHSE
ncbi:MAG: hypothetical protein HY319_31005 [Armatimonadetes bacterium]|nr:hypothetical protein [Armatimonadota bacterium]